MLTISNLCFDEGLIFIGSFDSQSPSTTMMPCDVSTDIEILMKLIQCLIFYLSIDVIFTLLMFLHNYSRTFTFIVACGGLYTAGSGMITSPGFPSLYPRNMYCVWRIEVQPHHTVAVTIHTLDLEGSFGHHCNYDHIYVSTTIAHYIDMLC